MKIPYIPDDAPFSGDQRSWLAGFLAGLHSQQAMGTKQVAVSPAVEVEPHNRMDILFGTQTGNSEEVASRAADLAKQRGFSTVLHELDNVSMDALSKMESAIIVVSTYGEGEMPDNANQFWESLSASTAPRLESLKYGVLALGDTSYDDFCQAGKVIDTRLEQLGAKRLGPRVDCDVDFEDLATRWLVETVPILSEQQDVIKDNGDDEIYIQDEKNKWGRKNPFISKVLENRLLSGKNSTKEIRHLSFDLGDSGITYETGDAVSIVPKNDPGLVEKIVTRLGVDPNYIPSGYDETIYEVLLARLEIMTPNREFIREVERKAGSAELSHVLSHGDKAALESYLWGKDVLDLLNLNPGLEISADDFIGWMKPLQHRAYSISSSPRAYEKEVHVTVSAVRWISEGRMHKGVASTFLADSAYSPSDVGIFISSNKNFRVPERDDVPMIMVGPGTGIAPFRAFLQERRERGAKGINWLFFGDQKRECDFIYQDEITEMSETGLLSRLDLAFSRDQSQKIYVQNRMVENGKALYGAIEDGGCFYVCGDASRMAKDVDRALHSIIQVEGSMSAEKAAEYVNRLKREKRYLRDVY